MGQSSVYVIGKPSNGRLLVVKLLGSQNSTGIFDCPRGLTPTTPTLSKTQLYHVNWRKILLYLDLYWSQSHLGKPHYQWKAAYNIWVDI